MAVYIMQKIEISVDIKSSAFVLVFLNCVVWGRIIVKGNIQRVVCSWKDLLLVIIPLILVFFEAYHMFSGSLRLSYLNDDAQNHMLMAMNIVRSKKIFDKYFNAYINAMLIEIASAWLSVTEYYKAFIVGDIMMHLLEVWMFYSVLHAICKQKVMKYLFPVICIFYFMGYPTFSFMRGNFVYWSTGGILFLFLVYALVELEKNWNYRYYYYGMIAVGVFGSIVCNKLYAVINTLCAVTMIIIIIIEKKRTMLTKKQKMMLWIGGIGIVLVGVFFQHKIIDVIIVASEKLSVEGYTYTSLYKEIILFFPICILTGIYVYKKKLRTHILCDMMIIIAIIVLGMYWLYSQKHISSYYYYKIYYCLWIMNWLLVAMAIDILCERHKIFLVITYILFLFCIVFQQLNKGEKESDDNKWMVAEEIQSNYFGLYKNNLEYFKMDYESENLEETGRYTSPELLNIYQFIWDNYKDNEIWFITDSGNYMQGRWFSTILGMKEMTYYKELTAAVNGYLLADNVYVIMGKQSDVYKQSQILFNKENIVYEDNLLIMLRSM